MEINVMDIVIVKATQEIAQVRLICEDKYLIVGPGGRRKVTVDEIELAEKRGEPGKSGPDEISSDSEALENLFKLVKVILDKVDLLERQVEILQRE